MQKVVKGTEGHRLRNMFEMKVSKRRGLQLQAKRLSKEGTIERILTYNWNKTGDALSAILFIITLDR